MEKNILNEIARMRKIMGLDENIFNTPQMGGVTNSKGTAGYIDNTSKMDKEYADSLKSKDDKIIEQVVHDIFKNDVITDKSEVEDIITHMRRDWLSKKGTDENMDVYGFIKSYMDSYIQGAHDHVSMSDERWGWSEKETDNSIYGQYANSIVDQAIEDVKGDEMYESTNGEMGYNPDPLGEGQLNVGSHLKVGDKLEKINTSAPGTVTVKKVDGNKIEVADEDGDTFQWYADGIDKEIKSGKLKLMTTD